MKLSPPEVHNPEINLPESGQPVPLVRLVPQTEDPRPDAPGTAYHQRLPDWVREDAAARKVGRTYLQTLQRAADAGELDAEGNVRDIWGGGRLAARAGVSYRTLQRHIPVLIANGYLVITRLGDPYDSNPARRCNHYAVPHRRGSLDGESITPASNITQLPVAGEVDASGRPKYQPVRVRAGGQPKLWVEPAPAPGSAPGSAPENTAKETATPQGSKNSGEGLTSSCRRPLRQSVAPISSPYPSPVVKQHHEGDRGGAYAANRSAKTPRRRGGTWLKGVRNADLESVDRLCDLLSRAFDLGLGGFGSADGERDRLRIVAMAVHCRRVATKSPAAMFASNISRSGFQGTLWNMISQDDEDQAAAMIRRHLGRDRQADTPDRSATKAGIQPGGVSAKGLSLSTNGRRALAALRATRCEPGEEVEAWRVLREQWPDMDRVGFDAAVVELVDAGMWSVWRTKL